MKYVSFFLTLVTLVALVGFVFLWQGAQLEVVEATAYVYNASEQRTSYDNMLVALEEGSFYGTILQESGYRMPESYDFVTYSVRLRNNGMLSAEWIQLEVVPDGADILAFEEGRGYSLAAKETGTISMTMLAYAGTHTVRTVTIQYYVFGKQFTVEAIVR